MFGTVVSSTAPVRHPSHETRFIRGRLLTGQLTGMSGCIVCEIDLKANNASNPFYSGRGRTLTVGGRRTGCGGRQVRTAQLHDDAIESKQAESSSRDELAAENGLLQYGTSYLDIASYGEYPADFRADEDFVQLNFFEAISASVLFVAGVVENQQKNRNKLYVTSQKKNTKNKLNSLVFLSRELAPRIRGVR